MAPPVPARRGLARARSRRSATPPDLPGRWRPARAEDIEPLYRWYLEPERDPFFIEIAGPTPTFDRAGFSSYCRHQAALWVQDPSDDQHTPDAWLLLTYIQPRMRAANIDWHFRQQPIPGSPATQDLASAIRALCMSQDVRKAQLLALAGDQARQTLAEHCGMRREGVLGSHFYHAAAIHDLVMFGWRPEVTHG